MTPAIRAHRILSHLQSYVPAREGESEIRNVDPSFGGLLGCYKNPDEPCGMIRFFEKGVVWNEGSRLMEVRYHDIRKTLLPNEKESRGINLMLADGSTVLLPVRGGHGKFRDSLEVLRFIDRVIDDSDRRTRKTH